MKYIEKLRALHTSQIGLYIIIVYRATSLQVSFTELYMYFKTDTIKAIYHQVLITN